MADSLRIEILREKFFTKISNFILDITERVDLDPYIPILELLRWLFVPSIDHRILALLEHFVYNNNNNNNEDEDSSCNESPQTFLCDMDVWLEASTQLNQLLRADGLSRVFVDSILLGNRIERIGRQLDNLSVHSPQFDWTESCERMRNWDYCHERYQSTPCPSYNETPSNNKDETEASVALRQSRKRKATYEDIPVDHSSIEDQTEGTKERAKSRSDKLRLVVMEQHPAASNDDYSDGCCCSSSSRRRTDYLKLPCDCRALKDKLFKQRSPTPSGKFDERLKNVCSCLNNVVERMDDDAINDAALTCDVRENYVRFKLGRIKSKLCMFATRIALGRRGKDKRRREKDVSSSTNGLEKERDVSCDRSTMSEAGCSTRFLWNPSRHCFATSSGEDDASADEKEEEEDFRVSCRDGKIGNNDASSCECTSQRTTCNRDNCPYLDKKIPEKSSRASDKKHCHFEKDDKVEVTMKDAEVMAEEVDEPVELTNIYVNEISICCCTEGYDTLEDSGMNTEKCCMEASTNTEGCRLKETSTQVFFKEIQFCTCYKNTEEELEIENFKMENQDNDVSCECNEETVTSEKFKLIEIDNKTAKQNKCTKETPFDEIIQQLAESPCRSSEFTDMMKLKINEIVDLNEKIRKKVNMIKDSKEVCSVEVQTLIKEKSCESVNTKIQVKTSVISFKSKVSGKTCATKTSLQDYEKLSENRKSILGSIKVCDNPSCGLNNLVDDSCAIRKSILTEVTASLENPVLQRLKTDVIYQCLRMSKSSSLSNSYFRSDTSSIEKIFIYDRTSSCKNTNIKPQHTCRCTKKHNFLTYLSDHLTRETFEKFKRILRFILKKLLEKARMLNELRKSRMRSKCHCSYCCSNESSSSSYEEFSCETCSCEKNSMAPRRLSGGGDGNNAVNSRECKPAKFTRSVLACRDVEYATTQKRYRRQRHRSRRKSRYEDEKSVDSGKGLRRCRTEIFATRGDDSCTAYRNSLAFTNSWKYCYIH